MEPLSDEAIEECITEFCSYLEGHRQSLREVARKAEQERLRQIVEWGMESCIEHLPKWQGQVDLMGGVLTRRECPKCWQELKKLGGSK